MEKKELAVRNNELVDILQRANVEKPKDEDVRALRKALADTPGLWRTAGDLVDQNFELILEKNTKTPTMRLSILAGIRETRAGLGYEQADELQRILIDELLLCKLQLEITEYKYNNLISTGPQTLGQAEFWERRMTAVQRRYLRAVETLAKVRKLSRSDPGLQINIATQSGQQVNVAGDLVRNDATGQA